MADGPHIENLFWQYLSAILANLCKFSKWRWRITGRYRSLNQSGNFRKFKMAENRHFENSFISISQSELSDFEQIWYSDANFHSEDGCLTKQFDFFQIENGGRTPYWKLFFCYISAPYWPIDAKFEKEMKNHMPIPVTWPKLQFSHNSRWRKAAILKTVFGVYVILVMK